MQYSIALFHFSFGVPQSMIKEWFFNIYSWCSNFRIITDVTQVHGNKITVVLSIYMCTMYCINMVQTGAITSKNKMKSICFFLLIIISISVLEFLKIKPRFEQSVAKFLNAVPSLLDTWLIHSSLTIGESGPCGCFSFTVSYALESPSATIVVYQTPSFSTERSNSPFAPVSCLHVARWACG